MKVIPNALRFVFHHKRPCGLPRASSVCGNGLRGVASHGTEPACNGSIPPVENLVVSFLSGSTNRQREPLAACTECAV